MWKTYSPNTNYGLLSSLHKAPILDLQWSLISQLLYTASADQTINITDLTNGSRVRKLRAHRGIINSLDRTIAGGAGTELLVSGSDDGTVRVWEGGEEGDKQPVAVFELGCPVTSVCWSADGSNIYAGALDNEIHVRQSVADSFLYTKHELRMVHRSLTFVNKKRSIPLQGTPTHQLPCPSPRTARTFSRPLYPHKQSSMTSVRSLPLPTECTVYS